MVVGPAGVIVVETKWSGEPWASPAGWNRIRAAGRQARNNARVISTLLAERGQPVVAQPLVVLWGGGTKTWSKDATLREVERTTVVTGTGLDSWSSTLSGSLFEPSQCDAVTAALRQL